MLIQLDGGAKMPTRAHSTDAGFDLYSREEATLLSLYGGMAGSITLLTGGKTFDTGVHIQIPPGYFGKIESRSGLNVKHCIVSCGGVIDAGYTGSIKVKLYNLGPEPYTVHEGDKIAQLILLPYAAPELALVDALPPTERGNNGFGSSGR